jgi:hypothetical protein
MPSGSVRAGRYQIRLTLDGPDPESATATYAGA